MVPSCLLSEIGSSSCAKIGCPPCWWCNCNWAWWGFCCRPCAIDAMAERASPGLGNLLLLLGRFSFVLLLVGQGFSVVSQFFSNKSEWCEFLQELWIERVSFIFLIWLVNATSFFLLLSVGQYSFCMAISQFFCNYYTFSSLSLISSIHQARSQTPAIGGCLEVHRGEALSVWRFCNFFFFAKMSFL